MLNQWVDVTQKYQMTVKKNALPICVKSRPCVAIARRIQRGEFRVRRFTPDIGYAPRRAATPTPTAYATTTATIPSPNRT